MVAVIVLGADHAVLMQEDDEGMSVSLADEFNITFEEFIRLIQVRDGKRRQAELRRALTPEDKARLMQNLPL